jgi:hypothetical protein
MPENVRLDACFRPAPSSWRLGNSSLACAFDETTGAQMPTAPPGLVRESNQTTKVPLVEPGHREGARALRLGDPGESVWAPAVTDCRTKKNQYQCPAYLNGGYVADP